MARALPRLLLPVVMIAAACGPAADGAAAGGNDTAQQGAAPPAQRDTAQAREDVRRLAEELFQAFVRGDTAAVAPVLAEDYVGFTGDGNTETKAQALAGMRRDTTSGGTTVEAIQLDSVHVRVYGDAAVAQSSGTFRARSGGQPVAVPFRNTDTFVWRDGRWQIVATHLSRVAGG